MCIDDINHQGVQHPYLKFGEVYCPTGEGFNLSGDSCYIIPISPNTYDDKAAKFNDRPYFIKTRFIEFTTNSENQSVIEKQEVHA
jgi:hypothetical protein